jgi:GTP-binding protein HflX
MKTAILFSPKDYQEEAEALARSAEYEISEIFRLPKNKNSNFYLNTHLLQKIKNSDADSVIIFDILKPRHFTNLYKFLINKKIIDKVFLLLEIFSLHAGSIEAKLQIELAKVKYELPLIRDMYRKMKLKEQQGPLGAGTYGVESLISLYKNKINKISKELQEIKRMREIQIMNNNGIPSVAIVGYTNAGKTSLFNSLTGLSKPVDEKMFTTTSPKRYAIKIKDKKIMLVDTVGFIRGVPPQIIEAFFVTLSEARYSSGLLLVVDISKPQGLLLESIRGSFEVLREIGVSGKPLVIIANKIDKLKNNSEANEKLELILSESKKIYNPIINIIPTSVKNRENLDLVRDALYELVS